MNRRNFVKKTIAVGGCSFISINLLEAFTSAKQDPLFDEGWMDSNDIIPAPDDQAQWQAWRDALNRWKREKQIQLNYDGSSYRSAPFQWVSSDFSCCFIMMSDSEFYDYEKNEYTINHLVEKGKQQYGGYDSVVLWHAYPRIGLDDRNQFDFYREMPHGLSGLKNAVKLFHQNNIRVFIDYNPWDVGTRREQKSDIDALVDIIKSIDADGIFLDTMKDAPDYREKLDAVRPGIVMEGEIALPLEHIQSHHMSWAQWFKDSYVPGVYRNKWFERRHMQHAIDRWSNDKTKQLHTAWMNGSGIMIWENVFGQWNEWNERDKSIYRTMYSIQHQFVELFSGDGWTPLSQESSLPGVYVSLWESEGIQLWTLVNRNEFPVEGVLMKTKLRGEMSYFDLVKGEEITNGIENGIISFSGNMCKRGIACFLSIDKTKIDESFTNFISKQKRSSLLASDETAIPIKNIQLISAKETVKHATPLKGMVAIPATSLIMNMEYTFRENGAYGNIQEYLILAPTHNLHSPCQITKKAEIKKFAIDETPVTNSQFKEFFDRSGYRPRFQENFLKHWVDGKIPFGKEDHPVVYVDLEDVRAYARWSGKRLPSEEEWQFAAQGINALNFPWGNEMERNKCNQNTSGETSAVKAFPAGISPFGCYDMCGNTWELTSNEYCDGRSRFVMLKGGSCYKAMGSQWYTDGGPQKNNFIAKMLLMWSGLDRCSTIGFRCVVDL
jgi:formylglycine-generating enzyme required for sulfatase activity